MKPHYALMREGALIAISTSPDSLPSYELGEVYSARISDTAVELIRECLAAKQTRKATNWLKTFSHSLELYGHHT